MCLKIDTVSRTRPLMIGTIQSLRLFVRRLSSSLGMSPSEAGAASLSLHDSSTPHSTSTPHSSTKSLSPTDTTRQLTKMARQYPNIYAKLNIMNFPFTVSRHDQIVMHRMKDVQVGDTVRLDRVRELGSPDYTIQGRPWVSPRFFEIHATVMEHGRGAKVTAKTPKQRKGHRRHVTIKPLTTTLRIQDIKIRIPEAGGTEAEAENGSANN